MHRRPSQLWISGLVTDTLAPRRRQLPPPRHVCRPSAANRLEHRTSRPRPLLAAPADALARLLEVRDVSTLVREVRRGAHEIARAESIEITLWRTPDSRGMPSPARHRVQSRPLAGRPAGLANESASARASSNRFTLLVPVRHGGRLLGRVRLAWRHAPSRKRIDGLRLYLAHAGAALARLAAEERLLRQHQRSEALLDSLPDACLLTLAADGVVRGVRGRLHESVGLDPLALVGRPLVGSDARWGVLRLSRSRLRALTTTARASGRATAETWLRGANREIQVQVTLVDLASGGELVCVLRDLTESKAMEASLLQHNAELTAAAERLKEIDVLKNEFMSNVSHELRTPLTAIIAYSEALQLATPDIDTQREFLRVISEQGHKLQRLIGGLLDIAKLESLATELKLQSGSLNDVVRAAITTVQPMADKHRIAIETHLDAALPCVYLDELRAQQIVWNLLTNAIKFSPPDSRIRVRTWAADERVWASVTDEGEGIAAEHLELIFEKFVQLDGSSTRRHGGVGLGLDLVKHLVELHGGKVTVESSPGRGSTFTFHIPVEKRLRPRLGSSRRPAMAGRSHS